MSFQVIVSSGINSLASELGSRIERDLRSGRRTIFDPITVVVPTSNLATWLKLRLADDLGVAAGLEFPFLEQALWQLLTEHDNCPKPRTRLNSRDLQRLILSFLMASKTEGAPEMEPVWNYIGSPTASKWGPDGQRRAWQLAEKLARLFPEYEIQRGAMIAAWNQDALWENDATDAATQRWQQRLYYEIFKPRGWRDCTLPDHLTLPQLRSRVSLNRGEGCGSLPVYWFGIGHMGPFHLDLLCELGSDRELQFFLPAPCWGSSLDDHELMQLWGSPCRQTYAMVTAREQQGKLQVSTCPNVNNASSSPGVLSALQNKLLSGEPATRQPQDRTLQVWACPGKHREVETVFNLILKRLETDPSLTLSDVAVVVTDIDEYLPYLQEVFSRHDNAIPYNIADANAARTSLFSTAVTSLLGLVGSGFTRRDVFLLLSNPCFLAAVGADLEMPRHWLVWADNLGIYHSYNRETKHQYCDEEILGHAQHAEPTAEEWGDAHTWLAGLRRLRLGRIMGSSPAPPEDDREYFWQGHIPYADLETPGPAMDRFSYAVELLFRQCATLGDKEETRLPSQWGTLLKGTIDACLAIPPGSLGESGVRSGVYSSLQALDSLDGCFPDGVTFDFARTHLLTSLEELPASFGRPLLTGITVTSPRQARLIPFREVYFLGLGEGQFPGEADRSTLDLRRDQSLEGDLSAPEVNRQIFLDILLAARDRLILTYPNRDLEKDAETGPCSVISQLQSYLERNLLPDGESFAEATAPLHGRSPKYLYRQDISSLYDPLVNYDVHDHQLALIAESIAAPERAKVEVGKSKATPGVDSTLTKLTFLDLRDFLVNPAEALLKRRLRLSDDAISGSAEIEEEPFVTGFPTNLRLGSGVQERYVRQVIRCAGAEKVNPTELFESFYHDNHLRSLTPDGVFKELDKDERLSSFLECITGDEGLDAMLASQSGIDCCSVSIGHGRHGEGAVVFPELHHNSPSTSAVLRGSLPFVWRHDDAVHALVLTDSSQPKELEIKRGRWRLIKHILEPLLFFVALQSGNEKNADGLSSAQWVGGRELVLHVSSPDGVKQAKFDIPATEAEAYLGQLIEAFLTTTELEDLPLSILSSKEVPWPPNPETESGEYTTKLSSAIETNLADSQRRDNSRMELLSLIDDLKVPTDALEKVNTRLMPLYDWRVEEQA